MTADTNHQYVNNARNVTNITMKMRAIIYLFKELIILI